MSTWRAQDIETLKNMTADGASASQIARAIGGGITRNAVIGKRIRLGLVSNAGKGGNVRRMGAPRTPFVKAKALPPEPIVELPPLVLDDGGHVTLLTVNDRYCRWPIGDPQDEAFHFCGRAPRPGRPYCDAHCVKAKGGKPTPVPGNKAGMDGRWT